MSRCTCLFSFGQTCRIGRRRLARWGAVFLLLVAAMLMPVSPLKAAYLTYIGANNGDWTTSANWGPAGTPDGSDILIFGGANMPLVDSATCSAAELVIGSGVTTTLTLGQSAAGDALYLDSAGTSVDTSGAGLGGGLQFACPVNLPNPSTWNIVGTVTVLGGANAGQLISTQNLTKTGSGLLVLGANNSSFSGRLRVQAGTVGFDNVTNANAGTTGLYLNGSNVSFDAFMAGITMTTPVYFWGNNDYTFNGTNALTLSGTDELHGGSPTLNINQNTLTISGAIGQDVAGRGLTKAGSGTLVLQGANTYSGGTTITAGMLQLGNNAALPTNYALTVNGGTLDLHGDCPARRKFQSGNEIKKWSNCLSNSG